MKILSMSGFIPEQICDTVRFHMYDEKRSISHYCGYASEFISQVLMDDSVDGAVYPKSCDSTRTITSYLSDSSKFLYQFHIPSYGASGAEEYFTAQIRAYKEAVETHYGITIDDIYERAEKINQRNRLVRQAYQEITSFSYSDYLHSIHRMLGLPLEKQEWTGTIAAGSSGGKRIFLVGSFVSNPEIISGMEKAGLVVAGDTLPESGRLVSAKDTGLSGDIYQNIAESILSMRLSPTQNSFDSILKADLEEIKRKSVQGVVFLMQKYCEAYDYLYFSYKAGLDALGIPICRLTVHDTKDTGKALLALEAFADII